MKLNVIQGNIVELDVDAIIVNLLEDVTTAHRRYRRRRSGAGRCDQ